MRYFLSIDQLCVAEINKIIQVAIDEKYAFKIGKPQYSHALNGKVLAMLFEKPSTRTRVSFELAMMQLGGSSIILDSATTHINKKESISDTARVLSRFVNAIMFRCFKEEDLLEMAKYATVPVINALTDLSHPCQILAAAMTFTEYAIKLGSSKLVWLGDFNNVTRSFVELAYKFGCELVISVPSLSKNDEQFLNKASLQNNKIYVEKDPKKAVLNANVIITDTWTSMGDESKDLSMYRPYQVNTELMQIANDDCLFSHCLPAVRGNEVTDEVIDGKNSIVFDETENRLHVQKAILLYMFGII